MGALYWKFFIKRRVDATLSEFYSSQPVAEEIKSLLHTIFSYVSENTTEQEWAIQTASSLFPTQYSATSKVRTSISLKGKS